ncbi:MAG: NAD(P)/FAD-dependent oxidoreductase [Betaproteobacteria bacterium]|nr:NAD(P)/FAD-dependent oxidoreductase [Betaproteobacteria bacterium]
MAEPRVVIVGAGPAGLTAALELVRAGRPPIVLDLETQVGGISRTIVHGGNRMDLGGHRFFSKSDWVMDWWREILPVESMPGDAPTRIAYRNQSRELAAASRSDSPGSDRVMLVRPRVSRIYYLRKFFDYPIRLSPATLANLGLGRTAAIGASYLRSQVFPRAHERTLEDFLVNRFGQRLYRTFFKDYTEKVWGVPCTEISAEWGAQRIKGLSIGRAVVHAVRSALRRGEGGTAQKATETSLIERFLYPKLGPGQLWEVVAERIRAGGGEIRLGQRVTGIQRDERTVRAVEVRDREGGTYRIDATHLISTMPIGELVRALAPAAPAEVRAVADGLPYRDFMTAGLLVPRMTPPPGTPADAQTGMPPDNWIYVQEPEVRMGRIQIFNNWSPAMVASSPKIFLGLEYFCQDTDDLWSMPDDRFLSFAARELETIGLARAADVEDGVVVRVPKAYPAYFGSYERLDTVRRFAATLSNLWLVGRNGMHRYNNQDHSMVSARMAVQCILDPSRDREAIWQVNLEQDYHEEDAAGGGDAARRDSGNP